MRCLIIIIVLLIPTIVHSQNCSFCDTDNKLFIPQSANYDTDRTGRYFKGSVDYSVAECDSLFILKIDNLIFEDIYSIQSDSTYHKTALRNIMRILLEDNPMGFPPDTSNGQFNTEYHWRIMIPMCWTVDTTECSITNQKSLTPCSDEYCCKDILVIHDPLCGSVHKFFLDEIITTDPKKCGQSSTTIEQCLYMCDIYIGI